MSCCLHFKHEANAIITILNSINERKELIFIVYKEILYTKDNEILWYVGMVMGFGVQCLRCDASQRKNQ